jgi:hypothetical protein
MNTIMLACEEILGFSDGLSPVLFGLGLCRNSLSLAAPEKLYWKISPKKMQSSSFWLMSCELIFQLYDNKSIVPLNHNSQIIFIYDDSKKERTSEINHLTNDSTLP